MTHYKAAGQVRSGGGTARLFCDRQDSEPRCRGTKPDIVSGTVTRIALPRMGHACRGNTPEPKWITVTIRSSAEAESPVLHGCLLRALRTWRLSPRQCVIPPRRYLAAGVAWTAGSERSSACATCKAAHWASSA